MFLQYHGRTEINSSIFLQNKYEVYLKISAVFSRVILIITCDHQTNRKAWSFIFDSLIGHNNWHPTGRSDFQSSRAPFIVRWNF